MNKRTISSMTCKILGCFHRPQLPRGNCWAKRAIPVVLVISILGLSACGVTAGPRLSESQFNPDFFAYLDNRIPLWMKTLDVPGVSVAVIREGEMVWSNAYGYADRENDIPMRVNTICRAESISKSVTAWGVLRLMEQGLLELDTPIAEYLSDQDSLNSSIDEQSITVRMLLSNTAGLPLGTIGNDAEYNPQDQLPSVRDYLLSETDQLFEPGHTFLYSNVGFNWLELLVEEASGHDFADYMQTEILTPLGMRSASYDWQDDLYRALAPGYDLQSEPVAPYIYPVNASGGLLADVESIAQFVIAGMQDANQDRESVLAWESVHLLHTPQTEIPCLFGLVADYYGFGHFIETLPDGGRAVWHGGQGHGWMTHFHANPETGDGIVILTNSQRSWPLIAKILSAWSDWSGVGPVKFSRINYGSLAMQGLIGIVVFAALWEVIRLLQGLIHGKRKWAPLSRAARKQRLAKMAAGIAGMLALIWSAAQPYLFVSSVFPSTARIAGISLFGLCIILVVSALFPRQVKS